MGKLYEQAVHTKETMNGEWACKDAQAVFIKRIPSKSTMR